VFVGLCVVLMCFGGKEVVAVSLGKEVIVVFDVVVAFGIVAVLGFFINVVIILERVV